MLRRGNPVKLLTRSEESTLILFIKCGLIYSFGLQYNPCLHSDLSVSKASRPGKWLEIMKLEVSGVVRNQDTDAVEVVDFPVRRQREYIH